MEDERPHESVGVLGRATQAGVEGGGDRFDQQVGQDLLAEKSGPGSVEELSPLDVKRHLKMYQFATPKVYHPSWLITPACPL